MVKGVNGKPSLSLLVTILAVLVSMIGVSFGAFSYGSSNRVDLEKRITTTETTCQYLAEHFSRIERKVDMILERMPR